MEHETGLEHSVIDGGIHRFIFHENDRHIADAFVTTLEELLREVPEGDCLLLIVDVREKGLPPVSYIYSQLRAMFLRLPHTPQMYSAYLYSASIIITLVSAFMDTLRTGAQRRLFKGGEEDEAVAWLIAQGTAHRQAIHVR